MPRPWAAVRSAGDRLRADRRERDGAAAFDAGELAAAHDLFTDALALRRRGGEHGEPVAGTLNWLGRVVHERGRLDEAHGLFTDALAAAAHDRSPEAGNAWNNLGRLAYAHGRLEEAAGNYARAREAFEVSNVDGDPRGAVAVVLTNLATVHQAAGDLDAALACSTEARTIAGRDNPGLAVTAINNIGTLHHLRGEPAAAADAFEAALAVAREAGLPGPGGVVLGNLGHLRLDEGDLAGAFACYEGARAVAEAVAGAASPQAADQYANLARAHLARGELEQARTWAQRAATVDAAAAPTSPGHARDLQILAEIATASGDLGASLRLLRRALAIHREVAPRSVGVANALNNVGVAHHDRGELLRALDRYAEALDILTAVAPRSTDAAAVHNNAGAARRALGDIPAALDHLGRAVAIDRAVAPTAPRTAVDLSNLGTLHLAAGDVDAALALLTEAAEIDLRAAPGSIAAAAAQANLAAAQLRAGDVDAAERSVRAALLVDEALAPRTDRIVNDLTVLADVHHARGRSAEELDCLRRAAEVVEVQRGRTGATPQAREQALEERHRALHRLVVALLAAARSDPEDPGALVREAFEVAEQARGRVAADLVAARRAPRASDPAAPDRPAHDLAPHDLAPRDLAPRDLAPRDLAPRDLAPRDLAPRDLAPRDLAPRDLVALDPAPLDPAPLDSARLGSTAPDTVALDLRATENGLRARLAATYRVPDTAVTPDAEVLRVRRDLEDALEEVGERQALGARDATVGPVALPRIRAVLRPAEVLFAYTVTDEVLVGWRVTGDAVAVRVLPSSRTEVEALVIAARAEIEAAGLHVDARPATTALARAVLWPLLDGPVPAQLAVVPDGALCLVPWDALPLPGGGVVVDRTVVVTAPSASLLETLRRRPPSRSRATTFAGFSIAGADGVALPATAREVERIAALFRAVPAADGGVVTFRGRELTREAVAAAVAGRRYVHFATHGVLNDVNPAFSGLVVAPDADGDLLAAHELLELGLDAEVVACSACESGLGRIRPGEGLVGLSRVLLAAGARTVVLTLAPVLDTTTARLMRCFYVHLLAGTAPAAALTAAKREMRRRDPAFRAPGTWAHVVAVGAG